MSSFTQSTQTLPLAFSPEVLQALRDKTPIVALESITIAKRNGIAMIEIENIIRENNATPATIAIIKGQIRVGLTIKEIQDLEVKKDKLRRIGRKDIATTLVYKEWAVTNGSAAMLIAHMAGIKVLVTADFQGVGIEGEATYEVSRDIAELGNTYFYLE